MHKKITHIITEEHFAHPMAVEIKKLVDNIKPKSINSAQAMQLNTNLQNYFTTFVDDMRSIIVNMTEHDLWYGACKKAYTDIPAIETILAPYYGTDVTRNITKIITTFVREFSYFLQSASKTNNITYENFLQGSTNFEISLASYLNRVNPDWDYNTIHTILSLAVLAWIAQADAFLNKNTTVDDDNVAIINKLFLTGQDNGTPSLSTVMYNGLMSQFG